MAPIGVKNLAKTLRYIAAYLHPGCAIEDKNEIEDGYGIGRDRRKFNDMVGDLRDMEVRLLEMEEILKLANMI
jgi:hypothetical protein